VGLFKNNGTELKRFTLGDLVYDEYYGAGVVIDLDRKFDEMEVKFRKPENNIWLTTFSVKSLEIISKAEDRELLTTPSQDKP
jgi:hypothetical protein|tara:strand:- start:535 stop:780 length:246 start_codon:yes stop_codon:yes gene_type:complete